jgi:hypothetical protein
VGWGGAERLFALGAQDEVAEDRGWPLAAGPLREQVDLLQGHRAVGEVEMAGKPRADLGAELGLGGLVGLEVRHPCGAD